MARSPARRASRRWRPTRQPRSRANQDAARRQHALARRRAAFDAQLLSLQAEFAAEVDEMTNAIQEAEEREARIGAERDEIRRLRAGGSGSRKGAAAPGERP